MAQFSAPRVIANHWIPTRSGCPRSAQGIKRAAPAFGRGPLRVGSRETAGAIRDPGGGGRGRRPRRGRGKRKAPRLNTGGAVQFHLEVLFANWPRRATQPPKRGAGLPRGYQRSPLTRTPTCDERCIPLYAQRLGDQPACRSGGRLSDPSVFPSCATDPAYWGQLSPGTWNPAHDHKEPSQPTKRIVRNRKRLRHRVLGIGSFLRYYLYNLLVARTAGLSGLCRVA